MSKLLSKTGLALVLVTSLAGLSAACTTATRTAAPAASQPTSADQHKPAAQSDSNAPKSAIDVTEKE